MRRHKLLAHATIRDQHPRPRLNVLRGERESSCTSTSSWQRDEVLELKGRSRPSIRSVPIGKWHSQHSARGVIPSQTAVGLALPHVAVHNRCRYSCKFLTGRNDSSEADIPCLRAH
ncbi:hypothetical protein BAUCODRAFT_33035 [Baudoinia panamericana UAMH 10762]|uniref:Uncharacterized protein n=1 Tax=Baudoinia panamericana (strain UAMH 10762) TaxID=717646 RepID=M2MKU3_BAUPA|nr:uncharacterized protein BAUCODRAFT_33035 [Baudoinia panamericana UAMH 10762]EMC97311.1 hypothetical protein BAUCODRAFT_33035 [Baudoinia panamericana UAMH 10762]